MSSTRRSGNDEALSVLARTMAMVGGYAAVLWAFLAWSVSILVQETETPTLSWTLGAASISLLPLTFNLIGWVFLAKSARRASLVCNVLPIALFALILATSVFR